MLTYSIDKVRGYSDCPPESRLEYLSTYVFDFVTYNVEMDKLFACKAIEVCKALSEQKTFDYVSLDESNYIWYLLMCNTSFFKDKINWGTSIRNAWWYVNSLHPVKVNGYGVWQNAKQVEDLIFIDKDEWIRFVSALIRFASCEVTPELSGKVKFFI